MTALKEINSLDELKALSPEERRYVYISELLTSSYPVEENGDKLVTLSSSDTIPLLICPDEPCYRGEILVRSAVAERLYNAATIIGEKSSGKLGLLIVDGHRPIHVQEKYFNEVLEEVRERLGPEASRQAVWHEATRFVADPNLLPPHSTGGAVDCSLFECSSKTPLSPGGHWGGSDPELTFTWSSGHSSEVKQQRKLLYNAMIDSGFVNLPTEWWHYSYGDQYWALVTGAPAALFGPVTETRAV